MFVEWITYSLRPGASEAALAGLEAAAGETLLGCWLSVLGGEPRIHALHRAGQSSDHEAARRAAMDNAGPLAIGHLCAGVSRDIFATLPCLPQIVPGAFGSIYEIRSYDLQAAEALALAREGWANVIDVRLAIAPITAVMHSVGGLVPRLVHIYPYRDLAHRAELRDLAIATGKWPPRGGADRNRVMATEIAVPARFSPLH